MKILIIAAHPDNEVLGMGATIKKLSKKNRVHLCVVSEEATVQYSNKKMIKVRRNSCIKCEKKLGITSIDFLDFPDMRLDTIFRLEITKKIEKIVKKYKPKIVYVTPSNDLNKDHQIVYDTTLVATRPQSSTVKQILIYEVPGTVKTQFQPNIYEDVSMRFHLKLKILKCTKVK